MMKSSNFGSSEVPIVPAVLAKSRQLLLDYINRVKPHVSAIHIDVMDNKFVPNQTVGLEDLKGLPSDLEYEFHWMVENPENWISQIKGKHAHIIHIEVVKGNWEKIKQAAKKTGSSLGLAINPETAVDSLLPYIKDVKSVLVMSVHPGFSGQKYISDVEAKIAFLRERFPKLEIEVDGGINAENAVSAVKMGASRLAAASAIFAAPDIREAIDKLRQAGRGGHAH